MNARSGALVISAVLLAAVSVAGQSRATRPSAPRRSAPAPETNRTTQPEATPAATKPERGAGTVTPPNQGYVVMPDRAPAGTASGSAIPSDPIDRAHWEFYDRARSISLTGKVTKVDWTNPNSYIYIAAEGGLWAIECGFIQFRQANVSPAVRVDETITVMGYLPKEQPEAELPARKSPAIATYLKANHLIRAGEITTVFGQKLTMGKPPTEEEMTERLKCSPFGC